MNVPTAILNLVWAVGPIAGLMQPFFGTLSDRCTFRWGRRRIFLVISTLILLAGFMLLAFHLQIGRGLGDDPSKKRFTGGIVVSIIAIMVLYFGQNLAMTPSRAMVLDLCDENEGNTMIALVLGFSSVISNLIIFAHIGNNFVFGSVLSALFVIPTLFCKEQRYVPTGPQVNPAKALFRACVKMPRQVRFAALAFFFSWCGYFPFNIYGSQLVGRNIFHGTPQRGSAHYSRFQQGVRITALGFAMMSLATTIFSFFSTELIKIRGGKRWTYFASQILAALCYFLLFFASTVPEVMIYFTLIGINMSVFNSVPFAITQLHVSKDELGAYAGILNVFVVLAQLFSLVSNALGLLIGKGNIAVLMLFSAAYALIGAVFTLFLKEPAQSTPSGDKVEAEEPTAPLLDDSDGHSINISKVV
eukprot:gnl/Trimastix_PCT/3188.p1 GENE.gnl/Trimastix_PCT/3188~~gnl/Trimastix_PCT/3188.p1  ORF type:complete len:477 (-),score=137.56 gnl/Trimastix_PCT/3188:43-1290(-)